MEEKVKKHVFIVGAKGVSQYGGYETFVDKLTEYHQNNENIQYHIACKANGDGCMDENMLSGAKKVSDREFIYHNARCFKVKVPDVGAAQAIIYDIKALHESCKYIKKYKIEHPVIYILACRMGLFVWYYYHLIHQFGGELYVNPDGHEWMRTKWSKPVQKYWKFSERVMVRYSDLVICDSVNIEKYIHQSYDKKGIGGSNPKTSFIAYGTDLTRSRLDDTDPKLISWYRKNKLRPKEYYLIVGRLVPENSFEIMIREFMASRSKRDLAIIATTNDKFLNQLEKKLHFKRDQRIRFVGTVYDQELLKKIRENAYAYLHGHTVGGTNPSLIEALGSTELNLLVNVSFNKEVAKDCALYWDYKRGSLASLIEYADMMNNDQILEMGEKAKKRIFEEYTWERICRLYEKCFCGELGYEKSKIN